ncbi:MAG TPA: DUF2490 domain-containing protein [Pedobacter sp.]|nr:DUF2490 domain-containing protein [Pedobacter sp.]
MKRILLAVAFLLTTYQLSAQTKKENTGWLFLLNSTKFSQKWGMHLDVQVRSNDNWDGTKNILFRPGITYFINDKQNVTAGYLMASTDLGTNTLVEHRIWEQYIFNHKIQHIFVAHRLRLEQRFLDQIGENFTQRLRYFIRMVKPLHHVPTGFTKGPFVALQNEMFFNIQNKGLINNSLFDQNRLYLAAGYRFSKKVDLELGYLNQAVHGRNNNTVNNVAQLALYTRF